MFLQPSGDAQLDGELAAALVNPDTDLAIPGIIGRLLKFYAADIRLALRIEIDIDVLPLSCIDVIRDTGNETGNIAGAACTAKPALTAMLTVGLQRVVIEEQVARQRDSAQHIII